MSRVQLQPAFVLHSRPYRDSSAIVELLTAEHGRLSAVARGARRPSRRGAVSIQPFVPLLVSWSGRSEMKTLGACELAGSPVMLTGNSLFSGLYLNELLMRVLHRFDPHPKIFASYASTLERFSQSEALDVVLRQFELHLLAELGYSFDMAVDARSGEPVDGQVSYVYEAEVGMVASNQAADKRHSYTGEELRQIASGDPEGLSGQAAKRLLREILRGLLGDEPLRSRQLFRQSS